MPGVNNDRDSDTQEALGADTLPTGSFTLSLGPALLFIVVCGLLIAVASLVGERRL